MNWTLSNDLLCKSLYERKKIEKHISEKIWYLKIIIKNSLNITVFKKMSNPLGSRQKPAVDISTERIWGG